MKKMLMLVIMFAGVVLCLNACGSSDEKVKGGTGLPVGWEAKWESTPDHLFHVWHVGDDVIFALVVYDADNNPVTGYDTSSTIWRVEPSAGVVTLSDTTGPTTKVTAISTGTFTLYCDFKGNHPRKTITVYP